MIPIRLSLSPSPVDQIACKYSYSWIIHKSSHYKLLMRCNQSNRSMLMGASITDRTIFFLSPMPKSFTFINVILIGWFETLNIHKYKCLQASWPTVDGERGTYRNQPWVTDDGAHGNRHVSYFQIVPLATCQTSSMCSISSFLSLMYFLAWLCLSVDLHIFIW